MVKDDLKAYNAEYYRKNREKILERRKALQKDKEWLKKRKQYRKEYWLKNKK